MTSTPNSNLHAAKSAKQDEFYTQIRDIEAELRHYRKHFKGKIVYLNCDDPATSNFFRYFSLNFEKLGLKRLIATSYNQDGQATVTVYRGDTNGNRVPDLGEISVVSLKGDGDFRSEECIALLKQADIVVTNPPFSLFREYVAQLVQYDKKFLIIGNMNCLTYREIWPFIQSNQIWLGTHSGGMEFQVPDSYPKPTRVDETGTWAKLGNVCWFTNMDFPQRHEDLILWNKYNPTDHPTYVNYDAINVAKTSHIPQDYFGVMGVPVSFLDKYNPDQFELIGSVWDTETMKDIGVQVLGHEFISSYREQGGTGHYSAGMRVLGLMEPKPRIAFNRILIRRKK
jgi:hypothetical protein